MSSALSSGLEARFGAALRTMAALAALFSLPLPAAAQDNMANQGGISTPMLSRVPASSAPSSAPATKHFR